MCYLLDEVSFRIVEKPFHAAIGIVGTDFAAIDIIVIGGANPSLCFLFPGFRMDLFGQAAFAVIFFGIDVSISTTIWSNISQQKLRSPNLLLMSLSNVIAPRLMGRLK